MLIEQIWVWRGIWSFEHGYGEFKWPDGKFSKEILLEDKENGKENLNGLTEEYIRESGKLESSMDFRLRPCRILNRDFCIVQMDCQIRQMKNPTEGSFHVWILENCLSYCMRIWIQSRIRKKFLPGSNLRGDLLFPF